METKLLLKFLPPFYIWEVLNIYHEKSRREQLSQIDTTEQFGKKPKKWSSKRNANRIDAVSTVKKNAQNLMGPVRGYLRKLQ